MDSSKTNSIFSLGHESLTPPQNHQEAVNTVASIVNGVQETLGVLTTQEQVIQFLGRPSAPPQQKQRGIFGTEKNQSSSLEEVSKNLKRKPSTTDVVTTSIPKIPKGAKI